MAAWNVLAAGGASLPADSVALLLDSVTNDQLPPLDRLQAAQALSRAELTSEQLFQLAQALPETGALELPALAATFQQASPLSEQLARQVLNGLRDSPVVSSLTVAQLEAIANQFPAGMRASVAPIRKLIGGSKQDISSRLKAVTEQLVPGNAEHGKIVFFSNRAACSTCHRVQGEGGTIGPNLSRIAEVRQRPDLLEAILFPNASLVNDYETYTAQTADGRTHQGVIHRATSRTIVLRNAQRQEIVLPRDSIEHLARSKTSIMPQGLDKAIRRDELSDLLAFLESLRD